MQIPGQSSAYSAYATNPYGQYRSKSDASQGSGEPATKTASAADAFLAEAKKTPAQRIREEWLARHKMSENDLRAMDDKKREAAEKEIAEEIKRRLTGKDAQRGALINATA